MKGRRPEILALRPAATQVIIVCATAAATAAAAAATAPAVVIVVVFTHLLPLQLTFLGYCGSSGAAWIDGAIMDRLF
jgi:hypothetical protein